MSIGHGPPEHRADALKHPPPRRLALVVPNRPHHREHVMRGNVGYRLAHQRHRVGVEARPPLFFRLAAVAPVGPLQREHRFDALGEGGGDVPAGPECRGVDAPPCQPVILPGDLPSLGERGPSHGPDPNIPLPSPSPCRPGGAV